MKARHIPFALKEKVEQELERLINLKCLEKVETSEWATSIVPIMKKDGNVRICRNFKLTVNPNLIIDNHPLSLIEEIFHSLQGGEKFSAIDLSHAYMQIPVHTDSCPLLTIITHKGLFRYTRLKKISHRGLQIFKEKWKWF